MIPLAPKPYYPQLGEECEIRLDCTGETWWLVWFVGGTGLPSHMRFMPLDCGVIPSCATVVEMRPVCS